MKKKKANRIVAIVLSFVMCFTMTTAVGFAAGSGQDLNDGADKVNLLVFGNSTSSGYRMPGFVNRAEGFALENNYLEEWATQDGSEASVWTVAEANRRGLGRIDENAYPWQLKKYLCNDGENPENCTLTPYCLNGMRPDELRAFLDEDFYEKTSAREEKYSQKWDADHNKQKHYEGFHRHHMNIYMDDFKKDGMIETKRSDDAVAAYKEASAAIQQQIKDADVIVVDLCSNNFGTYVGFRLEAFLQIGAEYSWSSAPNIYETLNDVDEIPAALRNKLSDLREKLNEKMPMFKEGAGQQLLDSFLYSAADSVVNFKAVMEWINANKKPGAKVIAVGLNNMLEGLKIQADGQTIDLGQIGETLFGLVNTYIKAVDKNADNYYYADISGGYETFASSIGKAESFGALLGDGDGTDGKGLYSINMMYDAFVEAFMGGSTEAVESSMIKPAIQEMLYEAAHSHNTLDFDKMITTLSQPDGMDAVGQDIMAYLTAKFTGEDTEQFEDAYWWGLMTLELRYLLIDGAGEHPNKNGCDTKFEAVKKALNSETTAQAEAVAEVKALLEKLNELINVTPIIDHLDEIVDVINKIRAKMPSLEEMQVQMAEIKEIKAKLNEYINKTLELMGTSMDELIAKAKEMGKNFDFAMVADAIKKLETAINNLPSPEQIKQKLETIRNLMDDQAIEIAKALYDQMKDLAKRLAEADTEEEYRAIYKELEPIIDRLKEIGIAIWNLPEYEKAMDEYEELLAALSGRIDALQDEVSALQKQTAKLKAKSINAMPKASMSIANKKAKINVSWPSDEDADGYVFKVNGKATGFGEEKLTYSTNAVIGKTYTFEVTPYVIHDAKQVNGKTFKLTYVPKVTVAKAKLTQLKKGKKSFTAKWAKVDGADGYQLIYKTGKKTGRKNVTSGNTTALKVKIKKGKKYTVQVRAYRTVNGKNYFGAWSDAKKVKIKKKKAK